MLISQEKRTSEKRRQTEKRTKIKCHNNMSGDRAFTNLSRSFNLFDENHLFFSFFMLCLYFTPFESFV